MWWCITLQKIGGKKKNKYLCKVRKTQLPQKTGNINIYIKFIIKILDIVNIYSIYINWHLLSSITQWRSCNLLKLNKDKTEALIFGTDAQREELSSRLGNLALQIKPEVKNLGVILDWELNFKSHVHNVTKTAFYHLRNIARVRPYLTLEDAKKLTHGFVFSHLDYCNALYIVYQIKPLIDCNSFKNSAARILTKTGKREHITPVLASLHWLPVTLRIDFKILLLVFKAQNGL